VLALEGRLQEKLLLSEQAQAESRVGKVNTALLEQLLRSNEEVLSYVRREEEYLLSLSECVNALNTLLLSPKEAFQLLTQQIQHIQALDLSQPYSATPPEAPSLQELQAKRLIYQEIITRKHEAGVNLQKTGAEVAKALKELLGRQQPGRNAREPEAAHEPVKPKCLESRAMLEKRVK
jgi:hypothetical protein